MKYINLIRNTKAFALLAGVSMLCGMWSCDKHTLCYDHPHTTATTGNVKSIATYTFDYTPIGDVATAQSKAPGYDYRAIVEYWYTDADGVPTELYQRVEDIKRDLVDGKNEFTITLENRSEERRVGKEC